MRALLREVDLSRRNLERGATWNPDMLRSVLRNELAGDEILLVSNREPYIHMQQGDQVVTRRPASGLVTAMEPIMRACSGTWIAHGSGTADQATVDRHDHIEVPPDNPSYTLRRVWLTEEEERGYYYGFANEGLWPLCHIAHVRPIFRTSDWEQYVAGQPALRGRRLRRKRAPKTRSCSCRTITSRCCRASSTSGCRRRRSSRSGTSRGRTPSRSASARGGRACSTACSAARSSASTRNTIAAISSIPSTAIMEARIEYEASRVSYGGHRTSIEPYPISIQWPSPWQDTQPSVAECRRRVIEREGFPDDIRLGIGVDRMDYTKGIIERFHAVEKLLEMHPEFVGRFVFVQIAAPTRSALDDYRTFEEEVQALAARINARFADAAVPPIRLKAEHHEPEQINEYFRAADICVVTSLHDGMNLVAKEFVAARDDEQGVLVLSQFTGAARELHDALPVNPYHVDQCAEVARPRAAHAARRAARADAQHAAAGRRSTTSIAGRARCCSTRAGCGSGSASSSASTSIASARWRSVDLRILARRRRVPRRRARDASRCSRSTSTARSRRSSSVPTRRGCPTRCSAASRSSRSAARWRSSPAARSRDARRMLAFEPRYLIGNHGAEGMPGWRERTATFARRCAAGAMRSTACEALERAGVTIEDKRYSLSLHYRRAANPYAAAGRSGDASTRSRRRRRSSTARRS